MARLEPGADTQNRPVLEHIEFVASPTFALRVVHEERPVPNDAGERDPVIDREVEAVTAYGLPGEFAAGAESADVAPQKQGVARQHLIADPGADHRVEPVDRS